MNIRTIDIKLPEVKRLCRRVVVVDGPRLGALPIFRVEGEGKVLEGEATLVGEIILRKELVQIDDITGVNVPIPGGELIQSSCSLSCKAEVFSG